MNVPCVVVLRKMKFVLRLPPRWGVLNKSKREIR